MHCILVHRISLARENLRRDLEHFSVLQGPFQRCWSGIPQLLPYRWSGTGKCWWQHSTASSLRTGTRYWLSQMEAKSAGKSISRFTGALSVTFDAKLSPLVRSSSCLKECADDFWFTCPFSERPRIIIDIYVGLRCSSVSAHDSPFSVWQDFLCCSLNILAAAAAAWHVVNRSSSTLRNSPWRWSKENVWGNDIKNDEMIDRISISISI